MLIIEIFDFYLQNSNVSGQGPMQCAVLKDKIQTVLRKGGLSSSSLLSLIFLRICKKIYSLDYEKTIKRN